MKWKLFVLFSIIAYSCKRNHNCFVQDSEGITYDTIPCKCYKDVINELEASPFVTDTGTYEADSAIYETDTAIYKVNCD